MCHLSSFCAKFGMTCCIYPHQMGKLPDCPFRRKVEVENADASTVELPSVQSLLDRYLGRK